MEDLQQVYPAVLGMQDGHTGVDGLDVSLAALDGLIPTQVHLGARKEAARR